MNLGFITITNQVCLAVMLQNCVQGVRHLNLSWYTSYLDLSFFLWFSGVSPGK
jgi:hypothetical protein